MRGRASRSDLSKVPYEFSEYILLKKFRCTPSQLDLEDYHRLENFLEIDSWVNETQDKMQKERNKN